MQDLLNNYAINVPKCELHVHIEGTLEPELLIKLSKRNNISIPYSTISEIKEKMNYNNLQDFLDLYSLGTNVLIHEDDFYELTKEYFLMAYKDNIRHTEIMFDPQLHTERGIEFETVLKGIKKAQGYALKNLGLTSKLICCFHRNKSMDKHWETFKKVEQYLEFIDGIGLDNTEIGYPCSLFQSLYEKAKSLGLHRIAHAGEEGPASNIWEAIDSLQVERVDHGVSLTKDLNLIQALIDRKITITSCPISNLKLKAIKSIKCHPLLKISKPSSYIETHDSNKNYQSIINENCKSVQVPDLINNGLKVCINSDDPSYFGGYINDNFLECINFENNLNWTFSTIKKLVENSISGSFLSQENKDKLLIEVERFHNLFITENPNITLD